MNKRLQAILDLLQKSGSLTPEEKKSLADAVTESDKEITITEFKLERTEKVKRTTAILLEETIAELEQKRKSVEAQNRELEIEASLERVRAQAMNMRKPDDLLDICEVLFKELRLLCFHELRNAMINIYDDDQRSFINYDYSDHGGRIITNHSYSGHPVIEAQVKQIRSSNDAFSETVFTGSDLEDWKKFRKEKGEPDDPRVDEVSTLFYYFYSIGKGALGISTYSSIAEEKRNVLKRFRNVFDFAYRRHADVAQAEAQAREAKIEAALEKVRASAMAMHNSNDISTTTSIVFTELKRLGIQSIRCGVALLSKDLPMAQVYAATTSSDGEFQTLRRTISMTEHSSLAQQYETWLKQENYQTILTGEELRSYYDQPFFHSSATYVPPQHYDQKEYGYYFPFSEGMFYAWTENSYNESELNILNRFKTIIALTFRRYLDLQKAEAQTKEAKIEAGLERVRSRAMAMQTSEELNALIGTVFSELTKLDLVLTRCVIMTYDQKTNDARWWMANSEAPELPMNFYVQYHEHPPNLAYFSAWRERKIKFIYPLEGTIKKEWDEFIFSETELKLLPDFVIAGMKAPDRVYLNASFYNSGNLTLASLEPLSDEHFDILIRFAKVFDLTYTRFNDLKQAEAQAKEAQIEAALERVRARTMGMQKSTGLKEVIQLVYDQFIRLNILIEHTGFIVDYKGSDDMNIWLADKHDVPAFVSIPYFDSPHWNSFIKAKEQGTDFFTNHLPFEEKNRFYQTLFTFIPGLPAEAKEYYFNCPGLAISTVLLENIGLYIENFSGIPYSEEENNILMRFGKVFQQTYTRFLDLQKAEAQAREAQIEAALERVRSRTMAMQRSEELVDVASVLFQQVKALGVPQWNCGFNIWDIGDKEFTYYPGSPDGIIAPSPCKIPLTEHPVFMRFDESRKRGDELLIYEKEGEEQTGHYQYMLSLRPGVGDLLQSMLDAGFQFPTFQIDHVANFSYGNLIFITYEPFTEMHDAFKRFAKVFEQTYTRFLDLQKAEAQVRESHIEGSLERVRGKTMAMHNSQDVGDTVATVFDELLKLNIKTNRCGILIFGNSTDTEVWTAKSAQSEKVNLIIGHLDVTRHPMLTNARNAWKNKEASFTYELIGDDMVDYYRMINNQPDYPIRFNMESLPSKEIHTEFYFPEGAVFAFTSDPIATEDAQIFKRLASVFGQTYRRYLDLQKAEAQAREAQIEAALERVRSRTMAMHESKEIADIVGRIFKELTLLDVNLNRVLIWIFNPAEKYISWWSANPEAETNAESYRVDYSEHPVFLAYYKAWQKRTPLLLYTLDDLKESWEDHLFRNTELSRLPKAVQDGMRSERKIFTTSAISDYGLLMAGSFEPFSDEVNDIIQRFGRVFQQSYTRYLDVQKAEAQAREATIEASLEKVRGKAMAMHNSNDLSVTASIVFTELRKLGINPFRCGVSLQTKESRKNLLYYSIPSAEGDTLSLAGSALLSGHPVLSAIYDCWVRGEDYFPVLKGESLINYYQTLKQAGFDVPALPSGHEQYGYYLAFSEGVFYSWSEKPYTNDELKILHRFKVIIDLTFRRYMELQKSEENATQAIRQASLDRVRAEIASMRTTSDLDRITPLIWKELNILGIPFVRCGVFIMDDIEHQMHTFLSSSDGQAIAAFHLPYETPGNTGEILSHWKNKQMYIKHWDETAFSELGELLVQQGAIPSKEVYMNTVPVGGIHLHCLPFLQGMLYVGNTSQLQDSDIHLIQSVADAFSTAYARYEDFNKLESAKVQIEKTLTDLKQTQTLLVQSEKMASLGELTAGIAHEIQNPLNFVNNFSEVSNELLNEMNQEIEKGNFSEVKAITEDVIKNLEKILHHGKRADGIVKGMLQHSRTSSGVKEPTDINVLADEYLRLAFHGFRAKDKSFNVATKTDFDDTFGKIPVVTQDIGRVVLNLITNAFYTVSEKKKQSSKEYEPTVTLKTKKQDGRVFISVIDNGNGISSNVLDKIFQPFFTTKPTGQGTGLGLSLSYDIVKAHGGDFVVETHEGEGSEFTISLPL